MADDVATTGESRDGWATFVVTERIRPTHVQAFEDWVKRANAQLLGSDGFLSIETVRADDADSPRYVTLIHFSRQDQLDRWTGSDEHQRLIAEVEPIIADTEIQYAEGVEVWFSLPPANRRQNPKYWRQVVLITPMVFGLILVIGASLGPLLEDLPELASLAISVTVISMLLTWPVMPWVTKLLRFFLYPKASRAGAQASP